MSVGAVFGGRAHGKLVHVRTARADHTRRLQSRHHSGVVGCCVAFEDATGATARLAVDSDVVLDGDRQTVIRADRLAVRPAGIRRRRLFQDRVALELAVAVQDIVGCLMSRQQLAAQAGRRCIAGG